MPRAPPLSQAGDLAAQRDEGCREARASSGDPMAPSSLGAGGRLMGLQRPRTAGGCGCGVPPWGTAPPSRAGAARSRWGKLQPFAFRSMAG